MKSGESRRVRGFWLRGAVLSSVVAGFALMGQAQASTVTQFYLGDHPSALENPPPYGLRLDGLFDGLTGATGGVTTFSFGNSLSGAGGSPVMTVTDDGVGNVTIDIDGMVFGGEDDGSDYGFGEGWYQLDFSYTMNVSASGTGWVVSPEDPDNNKGTLTAKAGNADIAEGTVFGFFGDKQNDAGFSFKFLQDDHRLGGTAEEGQGFWVGRGWLQLEQDDSETKDFLFIGKLVPTPVAALLGLPMLIGLGVMRRPVRDDA